jgi:hypothetical protein
VADHLHDRFLAGRADGSENRTPVLRREPKWAFSATTQC